MKRLVLAVFCLSVLALAASVQARPRTVRMPYRAFVNSAYDSSTPGFGQTRFSSIQSAVDGVPSAAVISIAPGRYAERVVVTRALTLAGSDSSATIIDAEGSGTPLTFSGVGGGGARSLTARNAGPGRENAGIVISESNGVHLLDVALMDNAFQGLQVFDSTAVRVELVNIRGEGYMGVGLSGVDDSTLVRLTVHHPNPILMWNSSRNTIEDNVLEAIVPGAVAAVGIAAGSHNNSVLRNRMTGPATEIGPCTVVRVNGSEGNVIRDNELTGARLGVYLTRAHATVVAGNVIRGFVNGDGVTINASRDVTVVNNTIEGTMPGGMGGIVIFGRSSGTRVESNTVLAGTRGISVHHESTENRVIGNVVTNVRWGLIADGASGNVFEDNDVSASHRNGFDDGTNVWASNHWSDHAGSGAYRVAPKGWDAMPRATPPPAWEASVPLPAAVAPYPPARPAQQITNATYWSDEKRLADPIVIGNGGLLDLRRVELTMRRDPASMGSECGIKVESGGHLVVADSDIIGNGLAICVDQGGRAEVRHSRLRDMGDWDSNGAMHCAGDLVFEDNTVEHSYLGVFLEPTAVNARVARNEFRNLASGISVWGRDAVIIDNVIANVIKTGISLFEASGVTVERNSVANVWNEPLLLTQFTAGTPHRLTGNSIERSGAISRAVSPFPDQWNGNYWDDLLERFPQYVPSQTTPATWHGSYSLGSANADAAPRMCRGDAPSSASPPPPPRLVAATPTSEGITLTWDPVEGATGYHLLVYQGDLRNGPPTVNRRHLDAPGHTVGGLKKGSSYSWRVSVRTADCDSAWSEEAMFITSP